MTRLLPYAQLVRLPNTFTAMADIFLGAIATGLLFQRWYVFLALQFASTFLYWSGMIWNDYFDIDQDRRERPGRPLASGRVSMAMARTLASGLMVAGLLCATLAGLRLEGDGWTMQWRPLVFATLLVGAIFLYDGMYKASVIGPVLMGLCRSLNILLGLSILSTTIPFWGWLLALILGVYIAGVTWFARTEARVSQQPILIAAAVVMLASLVLALTIPALAIERTADARPSVLFPYVLAGYFGFLAVIVVRAIQRPDPLRVQSAIKRAIFGLVVLDALLASAFVGTLGLLLIVLVLPGIILGRWVYST